MCRPAFPELPEKPKKGRTLIFEAKEHRPSGIFPLLVVSLRIPEPGLRKAFEKFSAHMQIKLAWYMKNLCKSGRRILTTFSVELRTSSD